MRSVRSTAFLLVFLAGAAACAASSDPEDLAQDVAVDVSPGAASVPASGNAQFAAAVTGTANTAVSWTVTESGGGSIDGTGLYSAPGAAGTFHVVATSLADPSKKGQATVTVTTQTAPSLWVSGYFAGWYWEWYAADPVVAVSKVDMTQMTHFIFGRYAPGGAGQYPNAGQLYQAAGTAHTQVEDRLITKAHAAGVKAIMMIGGAGDGPGFLASTTAARRAGFIQAILDRCVAKDYDGVDIDWEENRSTATETGQIISFLSELRSAAAQRPRYQGGTPFIITWPDYSLNVNTDLPVPAWKVTVAGLVDQFNLMTYGMLGNWGGWDTWLWAPITGEGATRPTSIASSVKGYADAGIPRSKIGMGLGFYGGGAGRPNTGPRESFQGGLWGFDDNWDNYAEFHAAGMLDQQYYVWDAAAQAGYYRYPAGKMFRGTNVGYLTTEDVHGTIQAKGAWAKAGNCGGTIVWTINYGFIDTLGRNLPMEAVKASFLQ
jgi:GH18 family chitinase